MDINYPPDTLGHYVMYLDRSIRNRTLQILTTIDGSRTALDHVILDDDTGAVLVYLPKVDAGVYAYGVYDSVSGTLYKNGNLIVETGMATILELTSAYTILVEDENKILECTGTFTITIPTGLGVGFELMIVNMGTGIITVASAGTLHSKNSLVTIADQYAVAALYHSGDDVHILFGDLT